MGVQERREGVVSGMRTLEEAINSARELGTITERDPSLDLSPEQCQPCETFLGMASWYGWTVTHECWAPILHSEKRCGGLVAFCLRCSSDHHVGGYNNCMGSWHQEPCPRNHPKCKERENEQAKQT